VLLLPEDRRRALFTGTAIQQAYQVHVARLHELARNFEARTAGAATAGDNLATRVDAARSDAAYARVLFPFLGGPGVVLAALLTAAVVAAGAERRRAEQALLRLRGAGPATVIAFAAVEALLVEAVGADRHGSGVRDGLGRVRRATDRDVGGLGRGRGAARRGRDGARARVVPASPPWIFPR